MREIAHRGTRISSTSCCICAGGGAVLRAIAVATTKLITIPITPAPSTAQWTVVAVGAGGHALTISPRLDAHLEAANGKLENATSLSHGLAIIAQALLDLDDSHTFFVPPSRTATVEYGWRLQMIGDTCYVVAVKPDSDAAAKGSRSSSRSAAARGLGAEAAGLEAAKVVSLEMAALQTVVELGRKARENVECLGVALLLAPPQCALGEHRHELLAERRDRDHHRAVRATVATRSPPPGRPPPPRPAPPASRRPPSVAER